MGSEQQYIHMYGQIMSLHISATHYVTKHDVTRHDVTTCDVTCMMSLAIEFSDGQGSGLAEGIGRTEEREKPTIAASVCAYVHVCVCRVYMCGFAVSVTILLLQKENNRSQKAHYSWQHVADVGPLEVSF